MSELPTTVVFRLACPDPKAWVVLYSDVRKPRVVEMRQRHPHAWSARVALPPGEYRCRCYGGDGRNATYRGPPDVDGGVNRGMDTLVMVAVPGNRALTPVGRATTDEALRL